MRTSMGPTSVTSLWIRLSLSQLDTLFKVTKVHAKNLVHHDIAECPTSASSISPYYSHTHGCKYAMQVQHGEEVGTGQWDQVHRSVVVLTGKAGTALAKGSSFCALLQAAHTPPCRSGAFLTLRRLVMCHAGPRW